MIVAVGGRGGAAGDGAGGGIWASAAAPQINAPPTASAVRDHVITWAMLTSRSADFCNAALDQASPFGLVPAIEGSASRWHRLNLHSRAPDRIRCPRGEDRRWQQKREDRAM